MRRKVFSQVSIRVGGSFFDLLEKERMRIQKQIGLRKNITCPRLTELLARSGMKFPKVNLDVLKNVKRKKS